MITRTASPTPRTVTALAAAVVFILAALGLRAEAQTDLDEALGRLDLVVARLEEGTARREALQADLAGVLDRLGRARSELARVHGELGSVEAEVAALAAEMERRQAALDRRAVSAYATRHGSVLDAILGAQSLGDVAYTLQILNEASQADHDHVVAVVHQRTRLERRQSDLASLRAALEANRAELERSAGDLAAKAAEEARLVAAMEADRAEAAGLVARLTDERDRAAAAERVAEAGGGDAPDPGPAPPPSSEPPKPEPPPSGSLPPDPGPAAVQAMIREDFAPLGADQVDIALCVADKESNFDPHAVNPVSGASGVYQFLPSTWESLSPAAGWGGASVFDAEANVAVAAWTVTNYGWGSWGPVAASCGA